MGNLIKKDMQSYEEITNNFQYQPTSSACQAQCIANILYELGVRHKNSNLENGFRIKEVFKICKYRWGIGPHPKIIIPRINTKLRELGYESYEFGYPKSDYSLLTSVLSDPNKSLPIIGVSSEYFKEQSWKRFGTPEKDHALIIISINDNIEFFDPLGNRIESTRHSIPYVKSLSTGKMIQYWHTARNPNWIMWVERITYHKKIETPIQSELQLGLKK